MEERSGKDGEGKKGSLDLEPLEIQGVRKLPAVQWVFAGWMKTEGKE